MLTRGQKRKLVDDSVHPALSKRSVVLEKILQYAVGSNDCSDDPYDEKRDSYLQRVKKYAQVCTAWRDTITTSKFLRGDNFYLDTNRPIDRDFVKSGFLSGMETIKRVAQGPNFCFKRHFLANLTVSD